MKEFEMPRVALQEMCMSESIAATCCYTETSNGLTTVQTSLSGGSLSRYSWREVYSDIIEFHGGLASIPKTHYTYYYPNLDEVYYDEGAKMISGGGYFSKDVVAFEQSSKGTLQSLWTIKDGKIVDEKILPGSYVSATRSGCDHMTNACPYNYVRSIDFAHVGSTMPHAFGTTQWFLPHPAQQYNS